MLCLCQIDSHVKRLDEDLNHFAEDLKQGTIVCESLPFSNRVYFQLKGLNHSMNFVNKHQFMFQLVRSL